MDMFWINNSDQYLYYTKIFNELVTINEYKDYICTKCYYKKYVHSFCDITSNIFEWYAIFKSKNNIDVTDDYTNSIILNFELSNDNFNYINCKSIKINNICIYNEFDYDGPYMTKLYENKKNNDINYEKYTKINTNILLSKMIINVINEITNSI